MAVVIKESNEGVAKMVEKNQEEKIASAGEEVFGIPGATVGWCLCQDHSTKCL